MANIYRAKVVSTPTATGVETKSTQYVQGDTPGAAYDALKAALEAIGTVQQIDTPELYGVVFASSDSGFVWAFDSTVLDDGETFSTTRVRVAVADTENAALTAVQVAEEALSNTVLGVAQILRDPLTGLFLDGGTVTLVGGFPLDLPAGNGAPLLGGVVYMVGFSLIANQGVEKAGNVQCVLDGDDALEWLDISDVYTFNKTGNPQYRIPVGNLAFPSAAPDKLQEGVRQGNANLILTENNICENVNQSVFAILCRYWQENSGPNTRLLFRLLTNAVTIEYVTGGADQMIFSFAGVPGGSLTLNGIPEDEMLTPVFRSDGTNIKVACYGADGVTLLDSDTAVSTIVSAGDQMTMGAIEGRVKRIDYLDGDLLDADLPAALAIMLTQDPFPVAA